MSLTFIAGYRDRDAERLRRSLESLKGQSCREFEMILVDYGSCAACSSEIREVVADYHFCRYIYSDTRGWMWNRSAALNTGARLSNGEFLFFTDVDIFYPRWFVEVVLKHREPGVFFASSCFRCPREFADWSQLTQDGFQHTWSEMKGKGLMCCPREALEAVGGLDEKFAYWGQEDHDFAERLARSGLMELDLQELHCYHQWHPHVIYELPLSVQFNNLTRYHSGQAEHRVLANEGKSWGTVVHPEDRPIYRFLDPARGLPLPNAEARNVEAFGVSSLLTIFNEIAAVKNTLWALPKYDASDKQAAFLNKVLRRVGWRLDRRLGYAGDITQGMLLAVPSLFRDHYLDGSTGSQPCGFFLT